MAWDAKYSGISTEGKGTKFQLIRAMEESPDQELHGEIWIQTKAVKAMIQVC